MQSLTRRTFRPDKGCVATAVHKTAWGLIVPTVHLRFIGWELHLMGETSPATAKRPSIFVEVRRAA